MELPQSDAWLKARLIGLLGDVRVLDEARGVALLDLVADLRESFTLGGNGLARGEGVCEGVIENMVEGCEVRRFGGERGEGDNGDFGDELGLLSVTRRNLEGERESERRSDLTAEVTSTWRTCVGEGNVSVPPPLFEYDMIVERNARVWALRD